MGRAGFVKPPEAFLQVERIRQGYLVSIETDYKYDFDLGKLKDSFNVIISDYHIFPGLLEKELEAYPHHLIVYKRRPKLGMSSGRRKIIFEAVEKHNSGFK